MLPYLKRTFLYIVLMLDVILSAFKMDGFVAQSIVPLGLYRVQWIFVVISAIKKGPPRFTYYHVNRQRFNVNIRITKDLLYSS